MRRFYHTVQVKTGPGTGQAASDHANAVYGCTYSVCLDGKPVRTPGHRTLTMPTLALAEAVAHEWQAQDQVIAPQTMPLTGLVNTVLDRTIPHRAAILNELVRRVDTDPLLYRASQPQDLVARQNTRWNPVLDWVRATYNVDLMVTTDMIAISQPEDSLESLRMIADTYTPFHLTALSAAAVATDSFLLALALTQGHMEPADISVLSCLEETYQNKRWGHTAAAQNRVETTKRDLSHISLFMNLCRSS